MNAPSAARSSLPLDAAVQLRTIGALIMRELHTRFGRDNIGYLWLFLEPALLTMGVAAIHVGMQLRLPWGMQLVPFYVSGYAAFMLFRSTATRAGTTLEANGSLLYHRQVTIFDLLFSRALLDAIALMGASLLLIAAAAAFGLAQLPGKPLLFLTAWGLNLWFCFGVSMLALAGNVVFPSLDRFIQPTTYLMLPLSGAFFILDQLPPYMRPVVAWVPNAQIAEMVREGQFGDFTSHYVNVLYIIFWCTGVTLLGLLAIRAVRAKVEFE